MAGEVTTRLQAGPVVSDFRAHTATQLTGTNSFTAVALPVPRGAFCVLTGATSHLPDALLFYACAMNSCAYASTHRSLYMSCPSTVFMYGTCTCHFARDSGGRAGSTHGSTPFAISPLQYMYPPKHRLDERSYRIGKSERQARGKI